MSRELALVEQRAGHPHGAPWVIEGGRRKPGRDSGRRLEQLRAGLTRHERVLAVSADADDEELESTLHASHASSYLDALRAAGDPVVLPEWTAPGMAPDMPVCRGAVAAAEDAVRTTIGAARRTLAGERFTYALCRPPGHHAGPSWLGGYCYLNTTAAAVHTLHRGGAGPVGVLDLDLHYPNGTAALVSGMPDTYLHSLHAWPVTNVPGQTVTPSGQERLVEFPRAPRGEDYLAALTASVAALEQSCSVLVVSLGYDTVRGDPHGCWDFEPAFFAHVGRALGASSLPLCIVQEGGYALDLLASCGYAFASGLLNGGQAG